MLVLIMLMITSLMAALILAAAIRIVPEYQRLVVFRLGRFVKVVGPGLVILLLFIDAAARVDLREHTAQQEEPATTQDNHRVTVDWMCSYQVGGLETRLREVVEAWGVKVRQVEIPEIKQN